VCRQVLLLTGAVTVAMLPALHTTGALQDIITSTEMQTLEKTQAQIGWKKARGRSSMICICKNVY
jgi:hypothetical protein